MSDGAKELILFLFKIDIEEALFISIPEEVTEFVDEGPDFQGNLNFLLIFHSFLLSLLPFEVLNRLRFGVGFSRRIG